MWSIERTVELSFLRFHASSCHRFGEAGFYVGFALTGVPLARERPVLFQETVKAVIPDSGRYA